MITLAIPTLRRFDLLRACVASAQAGDVRPDRIIVVDNSGGRCPALPGVELVMGRQPQSVARAWNDAAHLAGGDWLILANDDISFAPDTIARLLRAAAEQPAAGVVSALPGARYSLFLLRWACYQEVGPFDEGFAPAYFEDNDYARRVLLAGWQEALAPSAVRHGGSQTIASYSRRETQAHHEAFRAAQARYQAKWGGMPQQETYATPWNGGPPQ